MSTLTSKKSVRNDAAPEFVQKVRDRIAEIRDDLQDKRRTAYLYFLLEPSIDIVRYVGCCSNPESRFRSHVNGSHGKVSRWINSLRDAGDVPRMKVVAVIQTVGTDYRTTAVSQFFLAGEAERGLIKQMVLGRWYSNNAMECDLLNVHKMPDIFLPAGLDIAKYQT